MVEIVESGKRRKLGMRLGFYDLRDERVNKPKYRDLYDLCFQKPFYKKDLETTTMNTLSELLNY